MAPFLFRAMTTANGLQRIKELPMFLYQRQRKVSDKNSRNTRTFGVAPRWLG